MVCSIRLWNSRVRPAGTTYRVSTDLRRHKTGEHGLELPVHRSTATVIRAWQEALGKIENIHPDAARYLFPSPRAYGPQSRTHITPTGFHTNYWRWIDRIRAMPEVQDDPARPADY